jgi:hypothetical protein
MTASASLSGSSVQVRTVLFSFLSRADVTPLDQRSRADGFVLDTAGAVVADPAVAPAGLALEADPNLAFEHWGAYWRKVHGVRFVQAEGADDEAALRKLLRYDQIHRVAAGPSSLEPMPYRPPLDAAGKLFDTIIGHVEPYRRPAWDGAAYLQFARHEDLLTVIGTERVRRKILSEDRAMFRDLAPIVAHQHVVLSNPGQEDAMVLVRTHRRRPEIDRATFQHRWRHEIADLLLAQQEARRLIRRYAQLHNIGPTEPGVIFHHPATADIDGVSLMSFATMRDAETYLLSPAHAAVAAAEREIAQAEGETFWTGVTFTVVDQGA